MSIELDENQIRDLIEHISGTTKTVEDGLELIGLDRDADLGELTLMQIDEAVFTCEACGWTLSVDERADREDDGDGDLCLDCAEEGGD